MATTTTNNNKSTTPSIWYSCISLPMTDPVRKAEPPKTNTISEKDICSFIRQNQKYHGWRVYFDKETYPNNDKETLRKLEDKIIDIARGDGCILHRGGATTNGRIPGKTKKSHRINCCYYKYDKRRKADESIRHDFIQCSYRIQLEWDETHGWYVPINCRMTPHHRCRKDGNMHDPNRPTARGRPKKKKETNNAVLDDNDDELLVAGDLEQLFAEGAAFGTTTTSANGQITTTGVRKRSYLEAYQILNPLFIEMLNIANADPSKLPYFQEVMQNAISTTSTRSSASPKKKRSRTSR